MPGGGISNKQEGDGRCGSSDILKKTSNGSEVTFCGRDLNFFRLKKVPILK